MYTLGGTDHKIERNVHQYQPEILGEEKRDDFKILSFYCYSKLKPELPDWYKTDLINILAKPWGISKEEERRGWTTLCRIA